MKMARRKWLLVVALVVFIAALVCGCFCIRRIADVAAVQDSLERDWEIIFNVQGAPAVLPPSVDSAAWSLIRQVRGPEPEYLFLGQKPNRAEVWQDRFRALFRGRITEIAIFYPGRLRGDLGAALQQFPKLRRLAIHRATFSDKDWAYVFAGLKRLPNLEELEIGGDRLQDWTLEPLAGQQTLRKVTVAYGRLLPECFETFAQLPRLSELNFAPSVIDDGREDNGPPLPESQKMIRDALSKVKVEFRWQ